MIDSFKNDVQIRYQNIMENWSAGAGRDAAQSAFDSFFGNVNKYRETLNETSSNISKALQNYTF